MFLLRNATLHPDHFVQPIAQTMPVLLQSFISRPKWFRIGSRTHSCVSPLLLLFFFSFFLSFFFVSYCIFNGKFFSFIFLFFILELFLKTIFFCWYKITTIPSETRSNFWLFNTVFYNQQQWISFIFSLWFFFFCRFMNSFFFCYKPRTKMSSVLL